jgi:hypothetical protein
VSFSLCSGKNLLDAPPHTASRLGLGHPNRPENAEHGICVYIFDQPISDALRV